MSDLKLLENEEILTIELESTSSNIGYPSTSNNLIVLNEDRQEMVRRDKLQFKGINVADDGVDTTVAEINAMTNEDIDELFKRI